MFKHLLMPTDGSEASARAVKQGAELARSVGARVTLMSAIEPSAFRIEDPTSRQAALDAAQFWLDAAAGIIGGIGVEAQQRIEQERSVCQSILKAAHECGADLIVMGTHGAGALERLLVGSQTQKVLAQTSVPVLVLR
ncbi:UspA Universal stress protein UspA and related nucleotide-binding proteins [Comamonadaceae bacterium]